MSIELYGKLYSVIYYSRSETVVLYLVMTMLLNLIMTTLLSPMYYTFTTLFGTLSPHFHLVHFWLHFYYTFLVHFKYTS